ncbi:MAG: response regulator [Rhizobiaceae bacterium]|nr:response regulator [Rhizobiaceae bacterium]
MGNRIVVVEDEALIVLDIEEAVLGAGCEVVGYAKTIAEAHDVLDSASCDGVILDANLNGDSVKPIAERLKAANVPYIVVSGYSRDQLDFLDETAVLVAKPFNFEQLTASIRGMVASG